MPVHLINFRTCLSGEPSCRVRTLVRLCRSVLLFVSVLAAQPALSASVEKTGSLSIPSQTRAPADGRADYLSVVSVAESSAASSPEPCANAGDSNVRAGKTCVTHSTSSGDGVADSFDKPGSIVTENTEVSATGASAEPVLESIPLQIVSPGVSVSFELVTRNAAEPVSVTVDRLPDDAVIAENADGTHTFRWLTDLDDEGEHVFRFTALDADGTTVVDTRNAIIVIGDPSLGGSYPARQPSGAR